MSEESVSSGVGLGTAQPAEDDDGGRAPAPQESAADVGRQERAEALRSFAQRYGIVVAWAVVIVVFGALKPDVYLTWQNFATIFSSQAVLLLLAFALMIPLTVGEFDLSVAGSMGLSYVLSAFLMVNHHMSLGLALVLMLAAGVVVGVVNGALVLGVAVPSIVVTLGTGTVLYGIGYALLSGPIGGLDNGLTNAMSANVGRLQMPFFLAVAALLALMYVYYFRPLGKVLYFTGLNREATRLSGTRVTRVRFGSFVASSVLATCAGIVLAGLDGGGDPSTANTFLLPVFAAVFLGSAVIVPGRVNPLGTFVSVYFLACGVTGLQILGLTGWVEQVFYGAALVIGVSIARPRSV